MSIEGDRWKMDQLQLLYMEQGDLLYACFEASKGPNMVLPMV